MGKVFVLILLIIAVYIGYQFVDNFDPESIKGKNVVITGASTGIGEQLAYHYARLGANIVITARRQNKLKEVIEKCKQEGQVANKYHFIALDMANKDSPKALITFAEKKLGGINTLVLNHVVYHYGRWLGTPENFTQFQQSMNINFHAYVGAATHAIPALEKSKGNIVIVNSVAAFQSLPSALPYSAAKHALEGFFGGLRNELIMSNKEISITMCNLALVDTGNALEMMENIGAFGILNSGSTCKVSEAALSIVKAGAQRWNRLHLPYFLSKVLSVGNVLFPETFSSMLRDAFAQPEK